MRIFNSKLAICLLCSVTLFGCDAADELATGFLDGQENSHNLSTSGKIEYYESHDNYEEELIIYDDGFSSTRHYTSDDKMTFPAEKSTCIKNPGDLDILSNEYMRTLCNKAITENELNDIISDVLVNYDELIGRLQQSTFPGEYKLELFGTLYGNPEGMSLMYGYDDMFCMATEDFRVDNELHAIICDGEKSEYRNISNEFLAERVDIIDSSICVTTVWPILDSNMERIGLCVLDVIGVSDEDNFVDYNPKLSEELIVDEDVAEDIAGIAISTRLSVIQENWMQDGVFSNTGRILKSVYDLDVNKDLGDAHKFSILPHTNLVNPEYALDSNKSEVFVTELESIFSTDYRIVLLSNNNNACYAVAIVQADSDRWDKLFNNEDFEPQEFS